MSLYGIRSSVPDLRFNDYVKATFNCPPTDRWLAALEVKRFVQSTKSRLLRAGE